MPQVPMSEYVSGSHLEITRSINTMFMTVIACGMMVVASWMLQARNDADELKRVAYTLGVSLVFGMALGHLSGARHEGYINYAQAGGTLPWPMYKSLLTLRPLIVVFDVFMATAPAYALIRLTWPKLQPPEYFLPVMVALIIAGLVLNFVGITGATWGAPSARG